MARICTSLLTVALLALLPAGCDDPAPDFDADLDASFEELSRAELERVVMGGLFGGRASSTTIATYAALGSQDSCPVRSLEGDAVVFEGNGCVDANDLEWRGRLVVQDGELQYTAPRTMVFEDFGVVFPDGSELFTGTYVGEIEGDVTTIATDLTIEYEWGIAHHEQLAECTEGDAPGQATCVTSGVEFVEGIGTFGVQSTRNFSATSPRARLTLFGEQRLEVDTRDQECPPYYVDGVEAGAYCPAAEI